MLIEHRGEVEYDFRHDLHTSFRAVVEDDVEEALRLAKQLIKDPGTRLSAAVGGRSYPVPLVGLIMASLYTAWTGKPHPLIPDEPDNIASETETRRADWALRKLNT